MTSRRCFIVFTKKDREKEREGERKRKRAKTT